MLSTFIAPTIPILNLFRILAQCLSKFRILSCIVLIIGSSIGGHALAADQIMFSVHPEGWTIGDGTPTGIPYRGTFHTAPAAACEEFRAKLPTSYTIPGQCSGTFRNSLVQCSVPEPVSAFSDIPTHVGVVRIDVSPATFSEMQPDGCKVIRDYYATEPPDISSEPISAMLFTTTSPTTITLTGPNEVRPSKTGGKAFQQLTATVTEGGRPAPGVAITVTILNTIDHAGHEGHIAQDENTRPRGTLNDNPPAMVPQMVSLITDANGQAKFFYKAQAVSGKYRIKAECVTCATPAFQDMTVRVKDANGNPFVELFPMPGLWKLVGATKQHSSNHWLTQTSLLYLISFRLQWAQIFPDTADWEINDASLIWGGQFDICATGATGCPKIEPWSGSHKSHKKGTSVDVAHYPITDKQRLNFAKWVRGQPVYGEDNKISPPANQVLYRVPGHKTHYHIEIPQ